MSDICKINVSILKSYEKDFKSELNNFNNKTYTTFSSSYLKNCSDAYVRRMSNELQTLYDKVKKGYQNIDKWWVDYNANVEGLENYLSDIGSAGAISESSIRNSATQLPELKKYNLKFAGIIPTSIVGASYNTTFVNNTVASSIDPFSSLYSDYRVSEVNASEVINNDNIVDKIDEVGTTISNGAKSLWADVTDWWSDVEEWWSDDALPWIQKAVNSVWNVVKSVGATVAVFVQSLVEGILQFGEAIIDFVALVGTGVASIVTGLYDGGQAIYGAITGNEWSSATKQMWEGTMGFVSNQYVSGWFDSLYQNTGYGNWLAENAYGFDITRSIGSGIGYIAGVVVLTIATFGAGSVVAAGGSVTASTAAAATTATQMSITATAAGIGRGTQNAWADGADLLEGLAAGTLTGLWEGLQFYIGGKISGFGKGVVSESASKISQRWVQGFGNRALNVLSRIILDGVDGGVEGFVIPLITSIYKDGYYDENGNYIEFSDDQNIFERYSEVFDDNGGWTTVWTQASIGSATSLLGEAFDLRKYFKDSKNSSNVSNNIDTNKNIYSKSKSLEEQIALANYHSQKGRFSVIDIDDINVVQKEILDSINNPDDVMFKIGEQTYNVSELKNMLGNESNLKQDIINSIKGIDDKYLKARKAYMELNKKLHYDMDYIKGGKDAKSQIINKVTNFNNIKDGNKVVCKGWSELYKELLMDIGFDDDSVRINVAGKHRWIEIDIDGRYIIQADATDAINNSIDLSASKGGYATSGFICIDNLDGSWSGVRPKRIIESGNYNYLIDSNQQWLLEIDKELGYASNNGYFADEIVKSISLFGNSEINNITINNKIETLFDMDLPNNMDGYEVFAYYKTISNNLFGSENNPIKLKTLYLKNLDSVEPINVMSSENIVQLYGTSIGKRRFYNLQEAQQFIDSLK